MIMKTNFITFNKKLKFFNKNEKKKNLINC